MLKLDNDNLPIIHYLAMCLIWIILKQSPFDIGKANKKQLIWKMNKKIMCMNEHTTNKRGNGNRMSVKGELQSLDLASRLSNVVK